MYLVILRKRNEESFVYLAKDLQGTTKRRDQAIEFESRDAAIQAAEHVVKVDSTFEVKVVQQ